MANRQKYVYLTRRTSFCASHRLHSPHLTITENQLLYDKCNRENGHGHNYSVEVTLYGAIDPKTGILMNLTQLKVYMETVIMDAMDHRNLDKDVEYFATNPSTAENICVYIWENMKAAMGDRGKLLHEVKVWETDKNIAIYRGEYR